MSPSHLSHRMSAQGTHEQGACGFTDHSSSPLQCCPACDVFGWSWRAAGDGPYCKCSQNRTVSILASYHLTPLPLLECSCALLCIVLPPSSPSCSICSTSQCPSEVEVRIYKGDSFDLFGSLRKRRQSVETFILQVVKVMLGLPAL